jgi:hypothetical protein
MIPLKVTFLNCVTGDASGQVHQEGQIGATRRDLDSWRKILLQPRTAAMEATIFSGPGSTIICCRVLPQSTVGDWSSTPSAKTLAPDLALI